MKKVTTILAAILLMAVGATAQKLSYSAVVRNSDNELVVNANLTVAVSIANSNGGAVVYSETHNVTTNQNGLVTLTIGDGTGVTGSMSDVTWQTAFITSDYTLPNGSHVVNTTPVTAVPYALYAEKSGSSAASSASIDGGAVNFSMPISDFVNNLTDAQKAELCTALGCSGGGGDPGTEPTTFTCGTSTVKDVDNNIYHTVQIGTQCWMKENMRCTHYISTLSGTPTVNEVSVVLPAGATNYGYLYNWSSAMSGAHGVCPEGWHVPTKAEFQIMMVASGLTTTDYQSYTPANLLTTGLWNSSGVVGSPGSTNGTSIESDFSATPAGVFIAGDYFHFQNEQAVFWTTSQEIEHSFDVTLPIVLVLKYDSPDAKLEFSLNASSGLDIFASVRCIKDN